MVLELTDDQIIDKVTLASISSPVLQPVLLIVQDRVFLWVSHEDDYSGLNLPIDYIRIWSLHIVKETKNCSYHLMCTYILKQTKMGSYHPMCLYIVKQSKWGVIICVHILCTKLRMAIIIP